MRERHVTHVHDVLQQRRPIHRQIPEDVLTHALRVVVFRNQRQIRKRRRRLIRGRRIHPKHTLRLLRRVRRHARSRALQRRVQSRSRFDLRNGRARPLPRKRPSVIPTLQLPDLVHPSLAQGHQSVRTPIRHAPHLPGPIPPEHQRFAQERKRQRRLLLEVDAKRHRVPVRAPIVRSPARRRVHGRVLRRLKRARARRARHRRR